MTKKNPDDSVRLEQPWRMKTPSELRMHTSGKRAKIIPPDDAEEVDEEPKEIIENEESNRKKNP